MSQVPQIGCCILRSGIIWNSPRKRHETRETSKKKTRVSSAVLDGSVRPTWGWCSSRFIFQVAWFWWNPAAVMVALHGLQQSHVWPGDQLFPHQHDRKWSTIFYHIHHSVCPESWTEILPDIKFDDPSARRAWRSTNQHCKWVNNIFRGQNISK